ncbi:ATP phosphoribosyltransferase [Nonomuraea sp. NPDC049028]|uniref:ATP phosphoribosyltransferase n=1 Tax=Nonomuraea sp. NPDC049028 TaxID=3364348 RepID=UPI00371DEB9B
MVSLALPKGSYLERPILSLFTAAGLDVRRTSDRSYRASIEYGDRLKVAFYKPREIPLVVESGAFDLGLTGTDWIEETGAKVEFVEAFTHVVGADPPWRMVLAVPGDHPAESADDLLPGIRVVTEYPKIARQFFESRSVPAEVIHSFGAGEAKIPELADAVIDVDGPDSAMAHHHMRIICTLRSCVPHLIASPAAWRDADRRTRIQKVARLLGSVGAGAACALLTVRTSARDLPRVARSMPEPSWRAGTGLADADLVVLQGLAPRRNLAETIDGVLTAGALDVIESQVAKWVTPHLTEQPL